MTGFGPILRRLVEGFDDLRLRWALVGGLAVSARAEPRTTRDVDVAMAVADDEAAEHVVLALRHRGYRDAGQMIEQQVTGRLATMRLVSPVVVDSTAVVDLIFASTGIEEEIVNAASPVEHALRASIRRLIRNEPRLLERTEVHSMGGLGVRLSEYSSVAASSRITTGEWVVMKICGAIDVPSFGCFRYLSRRASRCGSRPCSISSLNATCGGPLSC